MSKFKKGDKVRICNHRNEHWNPDGEMDKWQGKIVTIKECQHFERYSIEEDYKDCPSGGGWCWSECDFTLVEQSSIHVYVNENTTTALLKEGKKTVKKATAKCSPHDMFDFETGARLALDRLLAKEVKRAAKVGEWIKSQVETGGGIEIGGIYEVIDIYKSGEIFVKSPKRSCYSNSKLTQPFSYLGIGYTVLEHYRPTDEPKPEPEYYNGKVICVKSKALKGLLTKGKIYTIKDGIMKFDNGESSGSEKLVSFNHLKESFASEFIEYKGEA